MKVRITKRVVLSAEPRSVDSHVVDTEIRGFGLRVRPSGHKSFFIRYRRPRGLIQTHNR